MEKSGRKEVKKASKIKKEHEVKKIKKANNAIIAIGGCMMQQKHVIEKLKVSYPYVDIIFGTHTLHKLPEDVYKKLSTSKKIEDVLDIDGEMQND